MSERLKMLNTLRLTLPPGPWHSQGNRVMAGSVNVCTVFTGRQVAVAAAIADLYALLGTVIEQEQEIERLRKDNEHLSDKLAEATEESL